MPTPKNYEHVYYVVPILYEPKLTGVPRSKLVDALSKEGLNNTIYGGYANIHLLPMFQKKLLLEIKEFLGNQNFTREL